MALATVISFLQERRCGPMVGQEQPWDSWLEGALTLLLSGEDPAHLLRILFLGGQNKIDSIL